MSASVIFAGTPDFAVPSLQALIDDDAFDVTLIVTQPDKPVGRKQFILPTPVKVVAQANNIEVFQPNDINTQSSQLKAHSCDFLVVVAYGQILSKELLAMPRVAPINVHASLLPRWRGAAPIQNAILAGDRQTGVTVQRMVEELDEGPVLAQATLSLDEHETLSTLHDRLADLGAALLLNTLKQPLTETPQKGDIVICHKLKRADGDVDPGEATAAEIDTVVRALVPWPGVRCQIHGHTVKLIETSLTETPDSTPLSCKGDTVLHVVKLQPPGKKPMSGQDWQRGIKS